MALAFAKKGSTSSWPAIWSALWGSVAFSGPSIGAETSFASKPGALEEIVVTAQKRDENIQTVPLSVSVVSDETIQRAGIFTTQDYAARLPNVSYNARAGDSGRGTAANIVIRGVTGQNTTARYIDDAAVPPGVDLRAVDVARIEVLRGPQGSLYGASSMGGAVKIATNDPTLKRLSGDAHTSLGTVSGGGEDYRVDGVVDAAIVEDRAGVRIVGYHQHQSGVFDRYVGSDDATSVHKNIDDEDTTGIQLKGKWLATDNLTITPRFIYQATEASNAHFADNSPDNFPQYRSIGLNEPYDDELMHSAFNAAYNGSGFSVVSATSYTTWELSEKEDATEFVALVFGLDPPIPGPISRDINYQAFQQELRIASTGSGPFGYQAGVYYFDATQDRDYYMNMPGIGDAIGVDTDLVYVEDASIETREYAAFGELSYDLSDRAKVIAGGRWFESTIDVTRIQDGIFNGGFSSAPGHQKDDGFNPKFSFQHDVGEDTMVYATAAKGYRVGGVNYLVPESQCAADLAALGLTGAPKTYASDSLWSYELGAKSTIAQRFVVNGALFYIDWSDIQQRVNLACGYPFTDNVTAARSQGAELEFRARPIDPLEVTLALGYTDAEITEPATGVGAEKGDRIQQVPEFTAAASADYSWTIGDGLDAFARADYQYQSESYTTFDQADPARTRDSWSVINARLGIGSGTWRAALFVDNLTDEHINYSDVTSIAAELPGRPRYATNRPRTIGVELGYKFGN